MLISGLVAASARSRARTKCMNANHHCQARIVARGWSGADNHIGFKKNTVWWAARKCQWITYKMTMRCRISGQTHFLFSSSKCQWQWFSGFVCGLSVFSGSRRWRHLVFHRLQILVVEFIYTGVKTYHDDPRYLFWKLPNFVRFTFLPKNITCRLRHQRIINEASKLHQPS